MKAVIIDTENEIKLIIAQVTEVMKEKGIDLSSKRPKSLNDLHGKVHERISKAVIQKPPRRSHSLAP